MELFRPKTSDLPKFTTAGGVSRVSSKLGDGGRARHPKPLMELLAPPSPRNESGFESPLGTLNVS
jgi:hypothetical protein